MPPADAPFPPDWEMPGALSIVVQGPLSAANLVETARNCRHWRALFPAAELILSISSTDLVVDGRTGGVLDAADLAAARAQDGTQRAALTAIAASCDRICLAEGALPLPPIKLDSKGPNNVNLQIAAAQAGLALARGAFVLRVRSDLVFLDRQFIGQYAEAEAMPRGGAARLTRRVLISWIYTLNPYTIERLPLHFSDWFHFGALEDVRRLWDVAPMTLRDAVHYAAHRHATGSNAAERLFNTRIAVEQHLVFDAFSADFEELRLDHHNDRSSADLAMDILLDNFALCDVGQASCFFPKYAHEFDNPLKRVHCLTREDWFAMAAARDTDPRVTLAAKIEAAGRGDGLSLQEALPRMVGAAALLPRDGTLLNGELVATGREGVLFSSGAIALPAGQYRARLLTTTTEGPGCIVLQVAAEGGARVIAERIVVIEAGAGAGAGAADTVPIAVAFDLPADAVDLLVSCRFEGLRSFAAAGLALERRAEPGAARFQQDLPRAIPPASLSVGAGARVDGRIVGGGQNGTLFFGPYAWIVPGCYTARIGTAALEGAGVITLKVTREFGKNVLARRRFVVGDHDRPELAIDFDVPGDAASRFEVVCHVAGVSRVVVTGVDLLARSFPLPPARSASFLRRRLGVVPASIRLTGRGPA